VEWKEQILLKQVLRYQDLEVIELLMIQTSEFKIQLTFQLPQTEIQEHLPLGVLHLHLQINQISKAQVQVNMKQKEEITKMLWEMLDND